MNARQKAKRYKKECKRLKSMMSTTEAQPHVVNQYPVVTLRTELLVDLEEIQFQYNTASRECGMTMLNKMLAEQLLHDILKYAKIETYKDPYGYSDKTLIRATMQVVNNGTDYKVSERLSDRTSHRSVHQ